MNLTIPTSITQEQYDSAFFATNAKTGDQFLVWGEKALWVAKDHSNPSANPNCYEKEVLLPDEVGRKEWVAAWCCSTKDALNDLDLEELAQGRIEWM